QAEDGIRAATVTGVQTCALPISSWPPRRRECRSAGARSVSVGTGDKAGKLSPAQALLRILDAERMVYELDHVAVRVVDVGVVLAGVLPAPLLRIGAAAVGHGAGRRRP